MLRGVVGGHPAALARLRQLAVGAVQVGSEAITTVGAGTEFRLLQAAHVCSTSCGCGSRGYSSSSSNIPTTSTSSRQRGYSCKTAAAVRGGCPGAAGMQATVSPLGSRCCFTAAARPLLPLHHQHAGFFTMALPMGLGEGLLAARRLPSQPEPFEDEYDEDEYEDGEFVDLDDEKLLGDLEDLDEIEIDEGEGEWEDVDWEEDEAEEGEAASRPPLPPQPRPRRDWRA